VAAEESETALRTPRRRRQKGMAPVALKTAAVVEPPITVRGLSEAMGRPAKELMRVLFERGEMVTINANIAEETAVEVALEFGVDLEVRRGRDVEEDLNAMLEGAEPEELLVDRPPVVTILGHVDHGKTTLLDKIRSQNVAAGEAGGITQHIAAYQVDYKGHKITFVDTPGHEAFGEMRARGANVTDLVVLVVAADDGVMPQTVECISHAKSAGVPIVVALNKIDLPDVKVQKTLQDLAAHDVLPAEWGGDTEVVRTSGATGAGIDDLLETLLVTAELREFKTNPERPAVGVCLEAFRDEGRGALAWLLVQKGTLHVGDVVLCGPAFGRIRAIYNDVDEEIAAAGPSTPVKVAGLSTIPGAGDHFFVMSEIDEARDVAETRQDRGRAAVLTNRRKPRTLEDILTAARGGAAQDLPLIVKADSPGSIEALRAEIGKLEHPEVRVEIVHEGVGGVNESDVYLASASGAIIIAFHVVPEDRAQQLAEREGVEIRRYNIIYEVTQKIKSALEGLLIPERVEVATGRALVLRTFHISRLGTIAGCRVLNGTIERSHRVHVIRDQTVINDYNIASLKREKDDAREVREGMECGIRLDGFNDIKEGDLLEAYRVDEIKRTLD
jgi:translation initiation factor IF-2